MTFTCQPSAGLSIEVAANQEHVRDATRAMAAWLATQSLSPAECQQWELVIAEATNNAVQHSANTSRLRIEASSSAVGTEIRITDHTCGFDWSDGAALPLDEESESGRGLFIIRSLTDSSSYLRGRDHNVLCLQRSRRTARPAPEDLSSTLDLMTEEVSSCYETLANIFRLSAEAARDVDPVTLAANWLAELRQIAGADFLTLRMVSANAGELEVIATAPESVFAAQGISLSTADLIESRAAITRQDQWFDGSTVFHKTDPLSYRGSAVSGLAHPLETGGEVIGVLTVGVSQARWEPKARELNVVRSLGDFLGNLLHSMRRRDEANHSRLIKRELQIAADIQRSLLPAELPQSATLQCAGHLTTAGEVGGDFLDGIALADGSLLLVVADVMGKGVPAALFATAFRSVLHSHLTLAAQPAALMQRLNEALFVELDRADMFITVQLVHLSADGLTLRSSSAGHGPVLLSDGRSIQEISADGPPLGISAAAVYEQHDLALGNITHILLHTDGLSDVFAGADTLSRHVLHRWLRGTAANNCNAWSSRDGLRELHCKFQKNSRLQDDATFLIVARGAALAQHSKPHTLTHAT